MNKTLALVDDRETLASRLQEARGRTDEIFSLLAPSALYERPIPERHRLVFYLGHVEAFDWNLIARGSFGLEAFHADFDKLFAFGIDPTGGELPSEPASAWPERAAIEAYNRRVRAVVDDCLLGRREPRRESDLSTVFHMAVEHRLMHAETLSYLLHELPAEAKGPVPPAPPAIAADAPRPRTVDIPAGTATLGRPRAGEGFGWDNEFEAHGIEVPRFSIDAHKVTNARFLEFVADGGYRARALWNRADWDWKESRRLRHPHFWVERDGQWLYRGMFAEMPLAPAAPVYVSHAEAAAFARWEKRVLPTEAQFHRAAYGEPAGGEREYPWGAEAPDARHGNFDFRRWDPTPVGAHPGGDSAPGVSELVGNGWEWTASEFAPFSGFRAHPLYAGYSADFFDGQHYVLKGAGPRSAACFLRRSFRNWFQPHYSYLPAAFRLVGP
jgi:ergothioneine biosynthesis protein EgtB